MTHSLTPQAIAIDLGAIKKQGRRALVKALQMYRDQGAIVLNFKLNTTNEILFNNVDQLCAILRSIESYTQKIAVDINTSIKLDIPRRAVIGNCDAATMKSAQNDPIVKRWQELKKRDIKTIRMIPNGFGVYNCFGGDALFLSAYFGFPVFIRMVETDTADHYLLGTAIYADEIEQYGIKCGDRGLVMRVDA